MKIKLAVLAIGSALALGTLALNAQPGPEGFGHHEIGIEHLTKELNLTADQQAKIQPILDQAKPQIQAIHQEAMQKMKAIMENTGTQIRPLLNADQQAKFDSIKKAHEDMHAAMKEMHDAKAK